MKCAEEFVYQVAVDFGLFEVDLKGRMWRIRRQQTSRWGAETKIVPCIRSRAEKNWKGHYLHVGVMLDYTRGIALAHRFVWRWFNGKILDGLTLNHKDGNKHNNQLSNLELATHSEQSLHAVHVLGWSPALNLDPDWRACGRLNGRAKLTEAEVLDIRLSSDKGVILAERFGVSTATISRVRSGQVWKEVACGRH